MVLSWNVSAAASAPTSWKRCRDRCASADSPSSEKGAGYFVFISPSLNWKLLSTGFSQNQLQEADPVKSMLFCIQEYLIALTDCTARLVSRFRNLSLRRPSLWVIAWDGIELSRVAPMTSGNSNQSIRTPMSYPFVDTMLEWQ